MSQQLILQMRYQRVVRTGRDLDKVTATIDENSKNKHHEERSP